MRALPNCLVLLLFLVSLGIGQEQICPPDVVTAFTGDQVAIKQLTAMAVSGNAQAQACLDLVMAYMWRNLAAAKGNETAKNARDALEKEMTLPKLLKRRSSVGNGSPRNKTTANWPCMEWAARDHCV